jgi:hypothetical protein
MTFPNNINSDNESIENNDNLPIKDPNDKRRHLSKHDKQVMWRRNRILTLLTQGCSTY